MLAKESKQHIVTFIPGLGDAVKFTEWVVNRWENEGYSTLVFDGRWRDNSESVDQKLHRFEDFIDHQGIQKTDIVGVSAAGSFAVHALINYPDRIGKVVNHCGRLRHGDNMFAPGALYSRRSKTFMKSVEKAEIITPKLSQDRLNRILTVRPIYDETVPVSTVTLEGAENIRVPTLFHIPSIYAGLTVYRHKIQDFLT